MKKNDFTDQYNDPRWQKKRLEIMERDRFVCNECGDADSKLNVHHRYYIKGKKIWDYQSDILITLCDDCHKSIHEDLLKINHTASQMHSEQLFFAIDIMNMLLLSSPDICLLTLEYLTSTLKDRSNE
jgi:hypothetical protein